jgi:seryl-tRNA synthetase
MLQVAFIRQHVEFVKERLAVRNFNEISLVDTIIGLDEQRKELQLESETTQAKVNAHSKEIGQLMAKGLKQEAVVK